MMYVKHFVICKALCTCVGDCSHYGHYYLTVGGGAPERLFVGSGLGTHWGSSARSRDLQRHPLQQRPRPPPEAESSPGSAELWV